MNTLVNTKTRGVVQIVRDAEKNWACSVVFYGQSARFNTVKLDTKQVIQLLRVLGAPAPVSGNDRHVIEFYTVPGWTELKNFNFSVQN